MIEEIQTLPVAASIVFSAMLRARSSRGLRLREGVEHAIEVLVDLGQHDNAQELIARLDDFDGCCDLEEDNEDCCGALEDWGSQPGPLSWDQRNWNEDPYEGTEPNFDAVHEDDQRQWGRVGVTAQGFVEGVETVHEFVTEGLWHVEEPLEPLPAFPDPPVGIMTPTNRYPFRRVYEGETDKGTPAWAIEVVHETWSMFLEWFDSREAAEKRLADWGPM